MPRKWSDKTLVEAVRSSTSYRSTLSKIGLKPTGGNYLHIKRIIYELKIDVSHFKGKAWNKGLSGTTNSRRVPTAELLSVDSSFQSYKLKKRLLEEKLLTPRCEICSWAKTASDGRLPLELDHINGNNKDNRISNLRILCPNCHSLQPTHRGRNIGRAK